MRKDLDINGFKTKLETELAEVEKELATVGRVNPENPADWEPTAESMDTQESDPNEVADKFESFEENTAILKELEVRLAEIKQALERIKIGTYGICTVCGEPIEEKRLFANPAATTCIKHTR